jgi:hypothetical protein
MDPQKRIKLFNTSIHDLCEKANSENIPTPYRVSLIDPKNDHKLFETECNREKENKEFSWKREGYPTEFTGPIRMQLLGANGLILQHNLETDESKEHTKEASAA